MFCCRKEGRISLVARFWSSNQTIWLPHGAPKCVWYFLITLLETHASLDESSLDVYSCKVCSRSSSSRLLILISERLIIRKEKRLRQQGNLCLHELRRKFTAGASTRQNSTIKSGRRSLVWVGRVLKRAVCSFCDIFQPPCIYEFCCILNERELRLRGNFLTLNRLLLVVGQASWGLVHYDIMNEIMNDSQMAPITPIRMVCRLTLWHCCARSCFNLICCSDAHASFCSVRVSSQCLI